MLIRTHLRVNFSTHIAPVVEGNYLSYIEVFSNGKNYVAPTLKYIKTQNVQSSKNTKLE